jgi:hypothetical protein
VLGTRVVQILPDSTASLELDLPWGEPGVRLRIEARVGIDAPGEGRRLAVGTAVGVRGRQEVRSARTIELREGAGTSLMDVFEQDGRRLVLALAPETERRMVAVRPRTVPTGSPVRLRLQLERVDGERFVPLESNHLSTFVGQAVEYSFRRGEGASSESVRVQLVPVRVRGEVAEIEVEVTGNLPGTGDPRLLSRRQSIVSSRGAVSSLLVTSGEPPAGYRFLITPDF